MFRSMCFTISARDGFGFFFSNAAPDMIIPDVQYPHCIASASMNASCSGWSWPSFSSPSIVVICLPATFPTGIVQARVICPSTSTVHAPHCASPQPYFVPVRLRKSRNTVSKLVCESTFTGNFRPFTFSELTFAISVSSMFYVGQLWYPKGSASLNHQKCDNLQPHEHCY